VAGLLTAFYLWLGPYDHADPLLRGAAMDAGSIADGETWRLVTALTVHSGVVHLVGNVLCLLWLGHAACAVFGGGVSWVLVLSAGIAGNYVACRFRGPQYVSVGASTACFGALGVLTAYRLIHNVRRAGVARSVRDRMWLPLGAGLALLALLGTGVGSDVGAHLFGFLCGLLLALPLSWLGVSRVPAWGQRVMQIFCIAVVMSAWRIVLYGS
jgi:membrane associated rhomboid family serine protease